MSSTESDRSVFVPFHQHNTQLLFQLCLVSTCIDFSCICLVTLGLLKETATTTSDWPTIFSSPEEWAELLKFTRANKSDFTKDEFRTKVAYIYAHFLSNNTVDFAFLKSPFMHSVFGAHGIDFQSPDTVTVQHQMHLLFRRSQDVLMKQFDDCCLKGSLTFDGWSSGLRKFNGITFHYYDEDYNSHCHVVGFFEYDESSTAAVICHQVGEGLFCSHFPLLISCALLSPILMAIRFIACSFQRKHYQPWVL
jgi:hypothetical protein